MDIKKFQETIEDLIFNNTTYKELQTYLGDFNIFHAVGMSSQEIKHSAFLAYLLNPTAPHHLSDTLLKEFLITAVKQVEIELSSIEIDTSDYSNSSVRTEELTDQRQRIDIFVQNDSHKLIVVIENKVYSGETGTQLSDYKTFVESKYSDYRHLFVYLTPDERTPQDDDMATTYANVTYSDIAEIIERTIVNTKNRGNQEQITLMRHYVEMLKRQGIIDDPMVNTYQKLWNKQYAPALDILKEIYENHIVANYSEEFHRIATQLEKSRHQATFEFLYSLKPDLRTQIKNYFIALIAEDPRFSLIGERRYIIGFSLKEWDLLINTSEIDANRPSYDHILIDFHLGNYKDVLFLSAGVHIRDRDLRSQLVTHIHSNRHEYKDAFNKIRRKVNKMHNQIFTHLWLYESDLNTTTVLTSDLKEKIKKQWGITIKNHIVPLQAVIQELKEKDNWKQAEAFWRASNTSEGNE